MADQHISISQRDDTVISISATITTVAGMQKLMAYLEKYKEILQITVASKVQDLQDVIEEEKAIREMALRKEVEEAEAQWEKRNKDQRDALAKAEIEEWDRHRKARQEVAEAEQRMKDRAKHPPVLKHSDIWPKTEDNCIVDLTPPGSVLDQ